MAWALTKYVQHQVGKPFRIEAVLEAFVIAGSMMSMKVLSLAYYGRVLLREEQFLELDESCNFGPIMLDQNRCYFLTVKPLISPFSVFRFRSLLPASSSFRFRTVPKLRLSLRFHVVSTMTHRDGSRTRTDSLETWPRRRRTSLWAQTLRDAIAVSVVIEVPVDSNKEVLPAIETTTKSVHMQEQHTRGINGLNWIAPGIPLLLTIRQSIFGGVAGADSAKPRP